VVGRKTEVPAAGLESVEISNAETGTRTRNGMFDLCPDKINQSD